jgi:hypothetical protein
MKKFPTIIVGAALLAPGICFSATVFSDDFNRAAAGAITPCPFRPVTAERR